MDNTNTELKTIRLQMVISPSEKELIDAWRAKQAGLPSRSEAIRQLVALGLKFSELQSKPEATD